MSETPDSTPRGRARAADLSERSKPHGPSSPSSASSPISTISTISKTRATPASRDLRPARPARKAATTPRTGAWIFWETLENLGVDLVFGHPGGAVIHLYDELFRRKKIRHILVRHEQAGVHMAEGVARATGRPGVVLVTSGPGATNTVTGITNAFMDSTPIVVFTGQVPSHLIGNDAFQEADIVGMTRPCTKHSYIVQRVEDLARVICEAFHIASTGRPGPVLVDIPKDVTMGSCAYEYPPVLDLPGYKPNTSAHVQQVRRAVDLILSSERPILYTGGGVIFSDAAAELTRLGHALQVPVTNTLMGLGGFPGRDAQFLGMLGMHGTYASNMAMHESDCIIAIGARFDDRVTGKLDKFAPHARIVHLDIDPSSIKKNVRVHVPIVGDVKDGLTKMLADLEGRKREVRTFRQRTAPWRARVREWQELHPLSWQPHPESIRAQAVIEALRDTCARVAVVTTEVGQHQMWTAQFFPFDAPRNWVTSGGLGTMGFGFPAAIGVQLAFPKRQVVCVAGDGSLQMNIQELATAAQHKLPVKIVLINNFFLGMVRQWQDLFHDRRYAETFTPDGPDFVKVAEAYGVRGMRAQRPDEVRDKVREALAHPGPVLLDVWVSREDCVYPMVPAGAASSEMLLQPSEPLA
jgi:acetolactate synthase-1/2/3 large subunit